MSEKSHEQTMTRRDIVKEDGRKLIFYSFESDPAANDARTDREHDGDESDEAHADV